MNRGVWIVGTDTDVGKTHISAQLLRFLSQKIDIVPMKPIQTGATQGRAPDLDACLQNAQMIPSSKEYSYMAPYLYEPACSPHLAARLSNQKITIEYIVSCAQNLWLQHEALLIEGSGGLLVPINEQQTMFDLVKTIRLPIVLVARGSLGTINHTLLSLSLLQKADLEIAGVIINDAQGPASDAFIREDNPATIASFGNVPILADLTFNSSIPESTHELIYDKLFPPV